MLSHLRRLVQHHGRNHRLAAQSLRPFSSANTSDAYDVVIVGGGIMGLSTAHFLKNKSPSTSVLVIERDPTYNSCSTTRSAASIRHQFSNEACIRMSLFGLDFLQNIDARLRVSPEDDPINIDLVTDQGYLFLATEKGVDVLRENVQLQRRLGCPTRFMTPADLKSVYPWLKIDAECGSVPHPPVSIPPNVDQDDSTGLLRTAEQEDKVGFKCETDNPTDFGFGGKVVLGSLGLSGEGWFDAESLLRAMKRKVKAQGVDFLDDKVVGFTTSLNDNAGATSPSSLGKPASDEVLKGLQGSAAKYGLHIPPPSFVSSVHTAGGKTIRVKKDVVNAAGASGGKVSRLLKAPLPIAHKKRCIFVVSVEESHELAKTAAEPLTEEQKRPLPGTEPDFPLPKPRTMSQGPLLIDTSGIWFRPTTTPASTNDKRDASFAAGSWSQGEEGRVTVIAGYSPSSQFDPNAAEDNFEVQHELWDEIMWPALASRVPAFEASRVVSSWAGHYETNTFDHNGVIGRHPTISNFVYACGFSGHGLQHAPATGRAVADILLEGKHKDIDVSCFAYERILNNQPLIERNIV